MVIKECLRGDHDSVDAYQSVSGIADHLADYGYMVVEQEGNFRGILTAKDLLRKPKRLVVDCLNDRPFVDANWPVSEVLSLMERGGYDFLPVQDRQRFVGVVGQGDLAKTVGQRQRELETELAAAQSRSDALEQELRLERKRRKACEALLNEAKQAETAFAAGIANVLQAFDALTDLPEWDDHPLAGDVIRALRDLGPARGGNAVRDCPVRGEPTPVFSLLLVDDAAVIRQLIANDLATKANVRVVGEACNGHDAVRLALRHRPDLILMDVNMPRLDGIAATTRILRHWPDARVVMMSLDTDQVTVDRALQAGALGYINKNSLDADLKRAMSVVTAGNRFLSSTVAGTEL